MLTNLLFVILLKITDNIQNFTCLMIPKLIISNTVYVIVLAQITKQNGINTVQDNL